MRPSPPITPPTIGPTFEVLLLECEVEVLAALEDDAGDAEEATVDEVDEDAWDEREDVELVDVLCEVEDVDGLVDFAGVDVGCADEADGLDEVVATFVVGTAR